MSMNRSLFSLARSYLASSCRNTITRSSRACNLHQFCNRVTAETGRQSSARLSMFSNRLSSPSKLCSCGVHQLSEGDEDLLMFLDEEIEYEKKISTELPSIEGFKAELNETTASFSRTVNGERVVVSFDVNDNVNMDDETPEEAKGDTEETETKMISYPSFKVQIVKGKGKTLQFYCEYNHSEIDQDENEEVGEDDQFEEPFRIEHVMILDGPDADDTCVYQAETDTMDPNLYNLLMNMLYERGVTNEFARSVLSYSTATEHHLYVDFLTKLHKFTLGK